jgi:hypothetical protein
MTPAEIFMESLGNYDGPFRRYFTSDDLNLERHASGLRSIAHDRNWTSPTKSTVHQFLRFFPEDEILKKWSGLMIES